MSLIAPQPEHSLLEGKNRSATTNSRAEPHWPRRAPWGPPQHQPGEVAVPARVVISEPLGAETLVTFQVGQAELVARCPASFKAAPGTAQTLYMNPAAMHLFDRASGQAL